MDASIDVLDPSLSNMRQLAGSKIRNMVSVMHVRQRQQPGSPTPSNVDRRKGFVDIVERLSRGVVAVRPVETASRNSSDEMNNRKPTLSTPPTPHRG
jgi:hypothetical protein